MNQTEIQEWLRTLCIKNGESFRPCNSDEERITVIKELLRWAKKDGMSDEDLVICRNALLELEAKVLTNPTEIVTLSTLATLE
jgi:hypothetical protein